MFELSDLPYEGLEPYISSHLLDRHYNGHHKTYVDVLNKLVVGTEFEGLGNESLGDIVVKAHNSGSAGRAIFNNAAQIWNHDFYWQSMKPNGGGNPPEKLREMIEHSFGSVEGFNNAFTTSGLGQFGSGWVWLVYDEDAKALKVVSTANADSPLLTQGQLPLATMDVWEHAYYLDYLNLRKKYIDVFLEHLLNWDFVLGRLEDAGVL
ncbi:superoxide dismutase [Anaplasma phagocytophilum]|uniref:Superoxide dismutase n=4 Tax=Anaplasma phagocytophilum TaxID=948 RepID=Q8RPM8_ANAPH|nr:superoxide dismutase [Anaplasma phagocytophilum]AAM00410.1 Fe superoxide dismutase [Anaplasma phagocytophilum]ABD43382.1 Fe superoxide dismutase [Anaplasma phagocytophilum str. HZ]AGR78759.1 superoxide dismutase [Anaplasma phagocytophilum str. HZ2]AGR80006.1 superoxide dismutase [Anaplasma phagocytophilum str. JM]AGR81261.1 superoxide dismutase [Anaplasma phagocytophilum str. Dog2]